MMMSLAMKSLLRSPARTLLTFVLLGAVSFAFFSQVVEYTVTSREFRKAAGQYAGIGTAEAAHFNSNAFFGVLSISRNTGCATYWPQYIYADPRVAGLIPEEREWYNEYASDVERVGRLAPEEIRYQPLTQGQIDKIAALPYISSVDARYMTAGVSDIYYRLDEDAAADNVYEQTQLSNNYYYNYSARAVVEATLSEVRTDGPFTYQAENFNRLTLEGAKLLAGKVLWMEPRDYVATRTTTIDHIDIVEYEHESLKFHSYAQKPTAPIGITGGGARIDWVGAPGYIYDTEYVKNLTPGSRYVFVLRFEPLIAAHIPALEEADMINSWNWEMIPGILAISPAMVLYDHLTDQWCKAVWPLDGAPQNYLDTEGYAPLRELIDITNADMRTFDMVYTEDMGMIMRFAQGDMAIIDGRALTPEDTSANADVCVVSRQLAEAYDLSIGDVLTMKLGTELFEQYKGLGAVAAARERYKPAEKTVSLEIVGVYADTDSLSRQSTKPQFSYSINTVFVPKSLLLVDPDSLIDHELTPAEFSFKVEDAWDIPAFLRDAEPVIEGMGLSLIFEDGGWGEISGIFYSARRVAMLRMAVLLLAIIAAVGLAVYLHISRKKKEYAIMRALGTTRQVSSRALLLPLMAVAAVSVLAGSAVAWAYSNNAIAQNNALAVLEGRSQAVSVSVPAPVAASCIAGVVLLVLLVSAAMLRRMGSFSTLALLAGGASGKRAARRGGREGADTR